MPTLHRCKCRASKPDEGFSRRSPSFVALSCAAPAGASPVAPSTAVLGAGDVAGLTLGDDLGGALDAARQPARDRGRTRLDQRAALAGQPQAPHRQPRAGRARLGPRERLQARPRPRRQERGGPRRRPRPRREGQRAEQGSADRVARRPGRRRARRRRRRQGRRPRRPPAGHRAHARAPHHRPERVGRAARPCRPRRAPRRPRRRSRPSRSRSPRCPACACRSGPRGSIPDGTLATSWVLANYGAPDAQPPRGGRQDRAQGLRALRRGPRRRRAAQRRQATRPSPSPASRPGCSSRCRSPSSATTRRRAAAPPRSASTRAAATARPSPRRAASSASAAAARPRRSSPRRSSTACRSSSPGAPTRLQTLDADRAWLGEGSASYAGCLFSQDGAAPYRKAYATLRRAAATPLDQRTYDADRLLRPPRARAAPARSAAFARRSRAVAGAAPTRTSRARAPRASSTRGRRASTAPGARRAMGRQRAVRAAARRSAADPTPIVLAGNGRGHAHGARVRRASLRAVRRPLDGRARSGCTASAVTCASARRPRRPAHERRRLLPGARRLEGQPRHRPQRRRRGREGHHRRHIDGGGVRPRRRARPAGRSSACPSAATRPSPPAADPGTLAARAARQPDRRPRTPSRARRRASGTSPAPAIRRHPGLHDQHQLQPRRDGPVQDQHADTSLPDRHLPDGLVRRRRRPQGRAGITGFPAADPAGVPDRRHRRRASSTAATGRVSASWPIPADAVSGVYFAHLVRTDGRPARATSSSSSATTPRPRTSTTRRPTPRGRPTTHYGGNSLYTGGCPGANPPRLQGQLQPARSRRAGSASGQDWVFNAEYPMVRWLERNGYDVSYETGVDTDRYGVADQATTRSSCQRATTSTGQASSAPTSRPRATRASTSPSSAATRCSGRRAGSSRRPPYRTLVCYKETHNPGSAHVDPTGVWTGAWRDPAAFSPRRRRAGPRTSSPADLHGQRGTTSIQVPAPIPQHAVLAPHVGRERERHASLPDGHAGLRVGLRHRQRLPPAAALVDLSVDHRSGRPSVEHGRCTGQRLDIRPARHRDPQHDALPRAQRSAGLRRRHRAVVLGPRRRRTIATRSDRRSRRCSRRRSICSPTWA